MDFARKNWIVLAVVAVIAFLMLRRSGFAMGAGAGAVSYIPPAGGTAIPGTAPVASPALALTHEISLGYAGDQNIPYGAALGPSAAARSGKGHF